MQKKFKHNATDNSLANKQKRPKKRPTNQIGRQFDWLVAFSVYVDAIIIMIWLFDVEVTFLSIVILLRWFQSFFWSFATNLHFCSSKNHLHSSFSFD